MHQRVIAVALGLFASIPNVSTPAAVTGRSQSAGTVRQVREAIRDGDYGAAIGMLTRALETAPDSLDLRLALGYAYFKNRQYLSAARVAIEVVDREPTNARAHAIMGAVLMRSGLVDDAAAAFGRAMQSDPDEPLALAGLAELDMFDNQLQSGLKRIHRAVTGDSREPDFLLVQAQIAARLERYEEAAESFERYLALAPIVEKERRERIKGHISFYRRLRGRRLHSLAGAESALVPFSPVASGLPAVDVMVNGKGPYRFVVDTGSGFVVLSEDAAARLRIKKIAKGGLSQGVSGSGRFRVVYGVIDEMAIGGVKVQSVPTYIRKVHGSQNSEVAGYIGLSLLANFKVAIDYPNSRLELHHVSYEFGPPREGDLNLHYRFTNGGMISIESDIGHDRPVNFIVDSGATSTVMSKAGFERHKLADKLQNVRVKVIGAGGIAENVPVIVMDKLAIEGMLRRHVRALVLDLSAVNETAGFEQTGILGSDFLRSFRVELDFARNRLLLRPPVDPGSAASGMDANALNPVS
jgi:predicted aspartyl protease